ncbi:hypothetical protein T484DRAFT_1754500 [Baffinella frigidus]|nr:hypothetical protein T484DRAFT_1754500 [Cryptophyta sp. CCMP2293]
MQEPSAHIGDPEASRRPTPRKSTFSAWVDNAFDDKRVTIACISVWFFVCLGGFTWLGIFGSAYMRIGPSPTLTYMGMLIDTMPRYMSVVVFVVISTAVNDFASDAISPWIQNTVMDHKSRTIPYNEFMIIFITQTWSLYCGTMSVASIALVFAQFDLIMIRLVVDLLVNQYTIGRFLTHKSHDPFRYHNEFLNESERDSLRDDNTNTNSLNVDRDTVEMGPTSGAVGREHTRASSCVGPQDNVVLHDGRVSPHAKDVSRGSTYSDHREKM